MQEREQERDLQRAQERQQEKDSERKKKVESVREGESDRGKSRGLGSSGFVAEKTVWGKYRRVRLRQR